MVRTKRALMPVASSTVEPILLSMRVTSQVPFLTDHEPDLDAQEPASKQAASVRYLGPKSESLCENAVAAKLAGALYAAPSAGQERYGTTCAFLR